MPGLKTFKLDNKRPIVREASLLLRHMASYSVECRFMYWNDTICKDNTTQNNLKLEF